MPACTPPYSERRHLRGQCRSAWHRALQCSESTLVSPGPDEQNVANTIWGLATLGWQAAEGPMRGALEAAAVRVAPSMNAQNVARAPRRPRI